MNKREVLADVLVLLLHALEQRGQAPERLLVVVRRVLGNQLGPVAVQRLAMLRDRIGEVPDHGARLRVAERVAAVLDHGHADDAARGVGLPVLAFGGLLLGLGQLAPPAQLLQQHVVELGVAGGEVGTLAVRAVTGQQRDAVAFDAEVGAEVAAAFHHVLGGVVQVRAARVLHLGRAVARPGQAEVLAVELVGRFPCRRRPWP